MPAASGRLRHPLFGDVLDHSCKQIELLLPIFAVAVEPDRGLEDWTGVQPAATDPAGALLPHQTCPNEHLNVLGDRLQRDCERGRDFRHQELAAIESDQDRAAHRVGQCGKYLVEAIFIIECGALHYLKLWGHGLAFINYADYIQQNS